DVVSANLQVADLAVFDLDATLLAVADVVAVNVRLVQVDMIEEDAGTAVVVDVTVGDDDVAVAVGEVDTVAAAADEQAAQSRLHHSLEANAVGLAMGALDLQVGDQ